jgi:hypothetical protein
VVAERSKLEHFEDLVTIQDKYWKYRCGDNKSGPKRTKSYLEPEDVYKQHSRPYYDPQRNQTPIAQQNGTRVILALVDRGCEFFLAVVASRKEATQ